MKFSDALADELVGLGYTHCYFVAGGNIMHMLNSCRTRFSCIPFAHEVGAAIATEYHNISTPNYNERAFCLVTAGPGITNAVTGVAGAWQESRELLILGGQVKRADLSMGEVRQRGIQEVNGVELLKSITKKALLIDDTSKLLEAVEAIQDGVSPRKGPVFLELPLDIQGASIEARPLELHSRSKDHATIKKLEPKQLDQIETLVRRAERPVFLIGGGVDFTAAMELTERISCSKLPFMTTYNGADRIDNRIENYFGRPNTWGMRYSNILLQQADVIIALGTRLGLQQTGFNWQEFAPLAEIVQIDIDNNELTKGHPKVDYPFCGDANDTLRKLLADRKIELGRHQYEWLEYCKDAKNSLPLSESCNSREPGYINPYDFWIQLSSRLDSKSALIPCSSGSSFTSSYQAVSLPHRALMLSNKSQASMGYGLSGAIGVALANPDRNVILVEGDGGFLQNIQELSVARKNLTNLGIYLWVNNGYASIRMTQKTYFDGAWLGCDTDSGLGFPDWKSLFNSFDIPVRMMDEHGFESAELIDFTESNGLYAVLVPIDPAQTFYPKISSSVTKEGSMCSNPLHLIGPKLEDTIYARFSKYLPEHQA